MPRFPGFAVAITCGIVVAAALAEAQESPIARRGTIVLQDVDDTGSAFSFRDGALVKPESKPELYSRIDLMLDLPHGLGANNPQASPRFSGKGGILDLGARPLAKIGKAPKAGYRPRLEAGAIVKGHSYVVLTADGAHYAKLEVINFDPDEGLLEFSWQYQPKPTNVFDQ